MVIEKELNMADGKDDIRDMKKLAWGMFIALTIFGSGMYGVLANENKKQDKVNENQDIVIKQKTESTMLIRLDSKNQAEHSEFRASVNKIKDDVGELKIGGEVTNIRLENIEGNISEIKDGMKELLKKK